MTQRSDSHVDVTLEDITLDGTLVVPDDASGIVVFAHSSGSSHHNSRNNDVAEVLRSRGLGTLVFDLLTVSEDQNQANQFDIELLTSRLVGAVDWLRKHETSRTPAIGLFGSSTGATAALQAAAEVNDIAAVVSHSGRVEMASDILAAVESPTLLIVDETDSEMLERNRAAYEQLDCQKELYTIPGAGQSFAGEGELEAITDVTAEWFVSELR